MDQHFEDDLSCRPVDAFTIYAQIMLTHCVLTHTNHQVHHPMTKTTMFVRTRGAQFKSSLNNFNFFHTK